MIQRRVIVSGKVQGVSFRASTQTEARKFPDLRGYVRNLTDGSVEALFVGSDKSVHALVAWCQHGPRSAHVTSLKVIEEDPDTSLVGFEVRI